MDFQDVSWSALRTRSDEVAQLLLAPAIEQQQRLSLQKESTRLTRLLEAYDAYAANEKEYADVAHQREDATDEEFKQLCADELTALDERRAGLHHRVEELLYPADDLDDRDVFLEIRAGTGGQEAALFAGDLLRMYMMYALKQGWHTSIVSESDTDLGGYREVVLYVQGKQVYGHLKHESGVHRVQRVPKTESSGRIHTSTATVAVMPEAEDVEISLNPDEIRIEAFRAGGAGGQHVNKTESAIRITHIPTGIVVSCQDERSQHKNKAKALKALQTRILAYQRDKVASEQSQLRREMVGTGERAEKVRTYNYPQNRVSDHQVELTLSKLDIVMEGNLDEIIQALMRKDHNDRRRRAQQQLLKR